MRHPKIEKRKKERKKEEVLEDNELELHLYWIT
jgi:hypothetical protein